MEKKKKRNKKRYVSIVTAVLVVAVATVTVAKSPQISGIFNPENFKQFNTNEENNSDILAGDGKKSDLADQNKDGKAQDKDQQQAVELMQQRKLTKKDNNSDDSIAKADTTNTKDAKNPKDQEVAEEKPNNDGNDAKDPGANDQPGTDNPGSDEPGTDEPATDQPGTDEPTTAQPGTDEPTTSEPTTSEPTTAEPTTSEPTTSEPTTSEPTTSQPSSTESWEDNQFKPKDPVVDEQGTLLRLEVDTPEPWTFYPNASYNSKEVTVMAVYQNNGKEVKKEISYGKNGYTISFKTSSLGNDQIAVFNYKGVTEKVSYNVMIGSAELYYQAQIENSSMIYTAKFPGPLGTGEGSVYQDLRLRPKNGKIDFSQYHKVMIAWLGNEEVKDSLLSESVEKASEGAGVQTTNYQSVVFLKEDSNGYLTNMLTGFDYVSQSKKETDHTYIYYPFEKDTDGVKTAVDFVEAVPTGFKIKREVTGDALSNIMGEQVLKQYTGIDTTVEVPMGVTKVDLEGKQGNYQTIRKMVLPESVDTIDFSNIVTYMPMLEEYEVTGTSNYKVVDGVLYSKDGKTLLSVPAGKTSIKTWSSNVTTIAEGAFRGCNIKDLMIPDTVTTLEKGCFTGYKGSVIRFASTSIPTVLGNLGYFGKLLVPDSDYDLIYKKWMLELKDDGAEITFGVMDQDGAEISEKTGLYKYESKKDVLFLSEDASVLAAVTDKSIKYYTIPDGFSTIEAGAFLTSQTLKEVQMPSSVKQLRNGALVLPESMISIQFEASMVTPDEMVFGDPKEGAKVPDIKIYVNSDEKEEYINTWSQKIDPIYGKGTTSGLFYGTNRNIVYKDNAKYERLKIQNRDVYRLLKVYGADRTAFKVPNRTVEIADGAFEETKNLEILSICGDVKKIDANTFAGNEKLETIAYDGKEPDIFANTGVPATTKVYENDGITYKGFLYEDGVLYGQLEDDSYELLNVPTDYTGGIRVKEETTILGEEAFKDCTKIPSIILYDKIKQIKDRCFENFKDDSENKEHVFDFTETKNLESVGDYAFEGCNVKRVIMPEQKIQYGTGVFSNCVDMVGITIPNITEIPDRMFEYCSLLQTINIDWKEVTSIGDEAFLSCSVFAYSLTASENILELPKVQTIGKRAFSSCLGIRGFVLSEDLVKLEEEAFMDCAYVEEITLQGKVEVISRYCFSGCTRLKKINLSEQQKKALRMIGIEAFSKDYALERADFGDCTSLTKMGESVFADCKNLSVVELPTSLAEIPNGCFDGSNNLSILRLNGGTPIPLGTKIFGDELPDYMHIWVKNDTLDAYFEAYEPVLDPEYGEGTTKKILDYNNENVEVVQGVTYEMREEGRVLVRASKTLSGEYQILDGTVRIEDEAFKGCTELTKIAFPVFGSSVSIGNRAFEGCTALETAFLYGSIPEWGDDTFRGCEKLNRVIIGANIGDTIPRIGTRAFKGCTNLGAGTNGRVSFLGKISVYGESCFEDCTSITGIYIASTTVASERSTYWLEEIEDRAFAGCKGLKSFLASSYVHLTRIGDYAFTECDSMTGPSVPASVKSIGEGCFSECDRLQYVSFYGGMKEYPKYAFRNCPNLIRTGGKAIAFSTLEKIGEGAYEGCTSLQISTSWALEKYTGLKEIGDNAFRNCKSLTYLMPSTSVTSIGNHVFDGCSNAAYLYLRSVNPPQFGAMDLTTMRSPFYIFVPDSKDQNDYIYRNYYKALLDVLEKDEIKEVLQSASDGASERVDMSQEPNTAKEEEKSTTEEKTTTERKTEQASSTATTEGTTKASSEQTTATTEQASSEQMSTEQTTQQQTEKSTSQDYTKE